MNQPFIAFVNQILAAKQQPPSLRVNLKMPTPPPFDYPAGLRDGRYIEAALPVLPFEDGKFDLACGILKKSWTD